MYSEVLGYRINLIYCAICVAIWDIVHIFIEYHERYERLQLYESFEEIGCLNDFGKPHCVAVWEHNLALIAYKFIQIVLYSR
jgi:hypothetical protein